MFAPSRHRYGANDDLHLVVRSIVTQDSSVSEIADAFLFGIDRSRQSAVTAVAEKLKEEPQAAQTLIDALQADEDRADKLHELIAEEFDDEPVISSLSWLLASVAEQAYRQAGESAVLAFQHFADSYHISSLHGSSRSDGEASIKRTVVRNMYKPEGLRHWLKDVHTGIERLTFSTFLRAATEEATEVLISQTARYVDLRYLAFAEAMLGRRLTADEADSLEVNKAESVNARVFMRAGLAAHYQGFSEFRPEDEIHAMVRDALEETLQAAASY
jgi:hypothetical protein